MRKKLMKSIALTGALLIGMTSTIGVIPGMTVSAETTMGVEAQSNVLSERLKNVPTVDEWYTDYMESDIKDSFDLDCLNIKGWDCKSVTETDEGTVYSFISVCDGCSDCDEVEGCVNAIHSANGLYYQIGFDCKLVDSTDGAKALEVIDTYAVLVGVNRIEYAQALAKINRIEMLETLAVQPYVYHDGMIQNGVFDIEPAILDNHESIMACEAMQGVSAITDVRFSDSLKAQSRDGSYPSELKYRLPVKAVDMNANFNMQLYTQGYDFDTDVAKAFKEYDYNISDLTEADKYWSFTSLYLPESVERVFISDDITEHYMLTLYAESIQNGDAKAFTDIKVATGNEVLKDEDGVLVDKTTDTLLIYPYGKGMLNTRQSTLIVDEASHIGKDAFNFWGYSDDDYIYMRGTGESSTTENDYALPSCFVFDSNVTDIEADTFEGKFYGYGSGQYDDVEVLFNSRDFNPETMAHLLLDSFVTDRPIIVGHRLDTEDEYVKQCVNDYIAELTAEGKITGDLEVNPSSRFSELMLKDEHIINAVAPTCFGDINLDGTVGVADLVGINMYTLAPDTNVLSVQGIANSDIVKDRTIDTNDTALLMNYIAMMVKADVLGKEAV